MRVGLFGGTFDPVHLGHVHAGLAVHRHLRLQQLRMILSARPGHRNQPETTNQQRWEMLQLACADHPELEPDDSELRRPGKSYAIDTVRHFRQVQTDSQLCWITGLDSYLTLPTWQSWQDLINYCHIVVVHRPGHAREDNAKGQQTLMAFEQRFRAQSIGDEPAGSVVFLELPMLNIAASQIRSSSGGNEMTDYLHPRVASYIKERNLYPTQEG